MAKLSSKHVNALRRERDQLLRELATYSSLIRGTYLERFSTCSRPNCACHQGHLHGPRIYVVVTREKKQRQIYVPQSQVDAVSAGIQQYQRLMKLLDRISAINLELMQGRELDEFISKPDT